MALVGMDDLRNRYEGKAPNGTVQLRAFDEGLVLTLGAKKFFSQTSTDSTTPCPPEGREGTLYPGYFVQIPEVAPPEGYPGVPILWSNPEDVFSKYVIPGFVITRSQILPAMNRWHPGSTQFRSPSPAAQPVTVRGVVGFDSFVERQQAVPFDIYYTLAIECRERESARSVTNAMLLYALQKYPPYSYLALFDSLGDVRTYDVFMEGVSPLDENQDVTRRRLGFSLSLRIAAELDLTDEQVRRAVTNGNPNLQLEQI